MQKTSFIFKRPETGKTEIVKRERWRWVAHYKDGTTLHQFDEATGIFHQFKEIDQANLEYFQMVSDKNPEGISLLIPQNNADLIHFYRNVKLAGYKDWIRLYFFGWKIRDNRGRSIKKLICIYPNDRIALIDEADEGEGGGKP